tara:strand:- start:732 stop:1754 length:1023 start_codon:yes stop_codon:yes gene_type:complete
MNNYFFLILIPLIFIVNYILTKKKILLNYTGQKHQVYTYKNQVPLSGGIFIILFFIININYLEVNLIIFFFIFFIIGLFTDLNIIKSPSLRFLIQILFLIFFIINFDLSINDIRIDILNIFLENYYFNIFFVLFCLLVLVNGSNFIDGNNCLAIGYFLIIYLAITNLYFNNNIYLEISMLTYFLITLFILLIFNLFNKLYLGDNGIYLLSIYTGFTLIILFKNNPEFSPYFIVNLLWYPAFEILFSMLRKLSVKFSPMEPDILHLHQLIYYYFNKKFKYKKKILNSLTGISINIYNFIIIYFASINIYNTKNQILFLSISLSIYLLSYIFFLNYKKLSRK